MFTEAERMATKTAWLRTSINTTFAKASNEATRMAQTINIRMGTMVTTSTEQTTAER